MSTQTTWLLKTEPDDYPYHQLEADKTTAWTGVRNPTAQMHMRAMAKGDEAFIYHTGNERAIVGLAKVIKTAYEDPDHVGERTAKGDIKWCLVDVKAIKPAKTPVTLADIRADDRFADFVLVKQSRLGVLPVPTAMDKALRKLAGL